MTDVVIQMFVQALISGFVMACVLVGLYLWQERRKMRKLRSGYATMLAVEVANIRDFTDPFSRRGITMRTKHPAGQLSREKYDGLISSSNIAVFDYGLQQQLHTFYSAASNRDYVKLRELARGIFTEVNKYAKHQTQE